MGPGPAKKLAALQKNLRISKRDRDREKTNLIYRDINIK